MWDWAEDESIADAFLKMKIFEKMVIIIWTILPLFRELFNKNYFQSFEDWMRKIIEATPAISYLGLDYILDFSKLVNVLPWMVISIFVVRFSSFKSAFDAPKFPKKLPGYWVGWMMAGLLGLAASICFYAPVYNTIQSTVGTVNFVRSINVTALHQIQVTFLFFYATRAVIGKTMHRLEISNLNLLSVSLAFVISTSAFAIAHDYTWSYVGLMLPMEALYIILMMWFGNVWIPIATHFLFDAFAYFFIS